MTDTSHKYTNKLVDENSPYLVSHAHNPVNWYPWGEDALQKAKAEDKPIFLSIGYAACHWCHVMEEESFENPAIAEILNEYFVSIKVDREQRPDLDQIYMSFTTAMTGQGGWPMSVFLTPELKPFFAGTYFPPDDNFGRPGFRKVISEIGMAYREDKESIVESSEDIYEKVLDRLRMGTGDGTGLLLSREIINKSTAALMQNVDHINGGLGHAPKFPHAFEMALFLRQYKITGNLEYLQVAEKGLTGMADGGIYDHLGGGFARYSTDEKWLVPHFEKMLYDNGLLVPVYADAFRITGKQLYLNVIRETLDFILTEMTDETGGFYSALDADSEGEEGKFYVWSKEEIRQVIGYDAEQFYTYYNVTDKGNFEGKNILNRTEESYRVKENLSEAEFEKEIIDNKKKLYQARNKRIRPLTDDKILTSWNGMALSAFCEGYRLTSDKKYLDAAVVNARFVKEKLFQDNKLTHSYREGRHSDGEFLEDYAYYIQGLIDLYQTDSDPGRIQWLRFADKLAQRAIGLFVDDAGRYYLRPSGKADLIMRPQEETDGSVPSPGSLMIRNLFVLSRLTDKREYAESAEQSLKAISGLMERFAGGMTSALFALDYYLSDKTEIVIIGSGEERDKMLEVLYNAYLPNMVTAVSDDESDALPLFKNRTAGDTGVSAYVCINSSCNLPVSTLNELQEQLRSIE